MFLKKKITKYTETYLDNLKKLKDEIENAEAIVIGAGAGLSTAAGHSYSGERFNQFFGDFKEKYGITDMYSGGFYPFLNRETYWAWWARHIYINRYQAGENDVYQNLFKLVQDKNYFVVTTNVDHQFQMADFDKKRLFYMQGDYGLWQCSEPCHRLVYDNESQVIKMLLVTNFLILKDGKYEITDPSNWKMEIPKELIPYCPKCGEPMMMNLRIDNRFVQEEGWYTARRRYAEFIENYKNSHILFLELGVGENTPIWIKYPFWQMTNSNTKATYSCLNLEDIYVPNEISKRAICLKNDIDDTLNLLIK